MIKVVGFDLDNTLYDQREYEYFAFWLVSIEVERYFGVDRNQYFENLQQLFEKGVREFTFDKAIKLCVENIPNNWENFVKHKLLMIYRTARPELHSFPWVKDLLKNLKKMGLSLVMITNGNADIQKCKINALGLKKYFDKIYISDMYNPPLRKPHLGLFNNLLRDFNIEGKKVLYVGDDLRKDKNCEKLGIYFLHYIQSEDPTEKILLAINKEGK